MKSHLKKFLLGFVATAMVAVGSAGMVSANNHSDTAFDYNLPKFQRSDFTNSRQKQDKSRSYAKVTEIGEGKLHVWTVRANGASVATGSADLGQGQSAKIYNRAYEMYGRTNIMLGMHTTNFELVSVHVRGVWSPDSI